MVYCFFRCPTLSFAPSYHNANLHKKYHIATPRLQKSLPHIALRPTEYGHAEVNGCGIHGIESPVKFELLGNPPSLRKRHHIEGKPLEDSRLTEHVGFGECVPDHCRVTESKLITSFSVGSSDICEFSERSTSEQLSENEDKQVIPVRKTPILRSVIEFGCNSAELPLRQIHCDLGEYISSVVHLCFFCRKQRYEIQAPGQYFSIIKQCA